MLQEGLGAPIFQSQPLLLRHELIQALSSMLGSRDGGQT